MNILINEFYRESLHVKVYADKTVAGKDAALKVGQVLKESIQQKGKATLILATGTSQFPFLEAMKEIDLDWKMITVFHLDEYVGLTDQHPASFRKFLKERILDLVKPGEIYFLNGDAFDIQQEIKRYSQHLKNHEVDVACIGIGENGHLAFNDPPVADFNDPLLVKMVELDEACRLQQLGEGWFPTLDDVPAMAVTLTIPAILSSNFISCFVPEERKAEAVRNAVMNEIKTDCPASVLRTHPNTILYLDPGSASGL